MFLKDQWYQKVTTKTEQNCFISVKMFMTKNNILGVLHTEFKINDFKKCWKNKQLTYNYKFF